MLQYDLKDFPISNKQFPVVTYKNIEYIVFSSVKYEFLLFILFILIITEKLFTKLFRIHHLFFHYVYNKTNEKELCITIYLISLFRFIIFRYFVTWFLYIKSIIEIKMYFYTVMPNYFIRKIICTSYKTVFWRK